MYFSVKCEKTQENQRCFKKPRKLMGGDKALRNKPRTQDWTENPRSWEKTQGVATLLMENEECSEWKLVGPIEERSSKYLKSLRSFGIISRPGVPNLWPGGRKRAAPPPKKE